MKKINWDKVITTKKRIGYKYRAISEEYDDNDPAWRLLKYGEVCFSNPRIFSQFNDPFDSRLLFTSKSGNASGIENAKLNEKEFYQPKLRILSLSKTFASEQQWCHYAAGRKGICVGIGFDNEKDTGWSCIDLSSIGGLARAYSVIYSNNKEWNIDQDYWNPNDYFGKSIFIKKKEWSYERELRVVYTITTKESVESDITLVHLPSRYIKSIYFGDLTPSSIIEKILEETSPDSDWICKAAFTYKIYVDEDSLSMKAKLFPSEGQEWKSMSPIENVKRGIKIEP